MQDSAQIKLGIPKGTLQEKTFQLFKSAGFNMSLENERSYSLNIDSEEIMCFLLRPQEIPKYVEKNKLDAGICGKDWVKETDAKVIEIADLGYSKEGVNKIKWVLAVPSNSEIKTTKDLEGKVIATEVINITKHYLKEHKVNATIEFSYGSTEAKPGKFCDAIVDLTETGASLRANNLKIIDTVFESSTVFIANKKSLEDSQKEKKIKNIALLLTSAKKGKESSIIIMHVPGKGLGSILAKLSSSKNPTIKKIAGEDFYDVTISVEKKTIRVLIPQLKRIGCSDIVELPMNSLTC